MLLFLLALLFPALTHAQKMNVESMVLNENDMTGNLEENLRKDLNGNYGGLVRVYLAASGAQFFGPSVLGQQSVDVSEYWVCMAKDAFKLQVKVPGYIPLDINFRKYGIEGIESRRTYVLTITLPQVGAVQQDDGMRYLAMTVNPQNSTVLVDGKPQAVDANGELSVLLPKGSHRYQVFSPGYATKEGTVVVGDDNNTLSVRLVSTQATIRVECATKGAQVFVNNQQRGVAPWSGSLAPGSYQVEARLDGYRPQKQTVTLAESDNKVVTIPELQMIAGRLNVDYRPLGSEVYVDGKKVGSSP
ncbi:MAG: PEGA domain-containing protein, partial [Bacteroidales bacterium]|nr:PEGA domain-containing protein [Bacteroidales bacterium]